MNKPDPQAMASAWMTQFADPASWQSWMKLPEPEANPIAGILKDAGANISPAALEAIKNDYLQKAGALWQDMAMMKTPALHDRRFAAPEWAANPLAAFSAASYLLNSQFLTAMAEAVEAAPREKQKIRFAVQQMVDAMSPANFLATNPEAQQKLIETKGESLTKGLTNMLADMQKGRISLSDESAFEVGRNVATTPGEVVFENELFQLIQYAPTTATVHAVPLLMVPPCINKFYILDLQPENSVVRYAVEQGNTVFLVSWRNPDKSLAKLTWDDYIEKGAIEAIRVAREISGSDKVNAFGFCVGGTIVTTALAVLAARGEQPAASLTLLTTLLDFEDTGVLDVFIDESQVAQREKSLAKGGLMPGRDLATTFSSLRPNDLVWNYVQSNYLKGKEPPPFDLLYWNSDSTNLPGPMFCYYLRNMYLENKLREPGTLTTAGAQGRPRRDRCARCSSTARAKTTSCRRSAAFKSMGLLNPGKPKQQPLRDGRLRPHCRRHQSGLERQAQPLDQRRQGQGASRRRLTMPGSTARPSTRAAGGASGPPSWPSMVARMSSLVASLATSSTRRSKPAPGRYVKVRAD